MEKWLTPPLILSIAAFGLTALNSYYMRRQDKTKETQKRFDEVEEEYREVAKRLSETESQLKVLSKQIDLFWGTVERQMAKKFRSDDE